MCLFHIELRRGRIKLSTNEFLLWAQLRLCWQETAIFCCGNWNFLSHGLTRISQAWRCLCLPRGMPALESKAPDHLKVRPPRLAQSDSKARSLTWPLGFASRRLAFDFDRFIRKNLAVLRSLRAMLTRERSQHQGQARCGVRGR